MSRTEEFFKKSCPQCGAPMNKVEFTPKTYTGKTYEKKNPGSHRKVTSGVKKGKKEVWWQCQEDFGHRVDE